MCGTLVVEAFLFPVKDKMLASLSGFPFILTVSQHPQQKLQLESVCELRPT